MFLAPDDDSMALIHCREALDAVKLEAVEYHGQRSEILSKILILESKFYQHQGMLSEAYHCIQDTSEVSLVSNGRLEKVRAEIHLEVADCDEVDTILQDENAAVSNEIDRVIDLMTLSVKKYEYEFGSTHLKTLKAK